MSKGSQADIPPRWISLLLIIGGLVQRVLPLVQGSRVLLQQPTEDGFMLLTVARNLAIGNGMSTSAGSIATNGVQPLITFLFSAGYYVTHGDKVRGVLLAMLISLALALAAGYVGFLLGERLLRGHPRARSLAGLAAALWFASPVSAVHTSNALETALYCASAWGALWLFCRAAEGFDGRLPWRRLFALGLGLGVAFWARNDAVFLIASVCLAWLGFGWQAGAPKAGLAAAITVGACAALLAAPWMLHNQIHFGSIVPVSGQAEKLGADLGSNLTRLPAKLAEYVTIVLAIPNELETRVPVQLACVVILGLGLLAALRALRGLDAPRRAVAFSLLGYAALLSGYYGIFFGAQHFLARYLAPLSLPFALLTVVTLDALRERYLPASNRVAASNALACLAILLTFSLSVRLYLQRNKHMHFQVVDWVAAHVPDSVWVAAVQTGTIGYFHDRTLNLDGKVNPAALKASREGKLMDYVLTTPAEYIADWYGIQSWVPLLNNQFEVVVADRARNLTVLKRREGESSRTVRRD